MYPWEPGQEPDRQERRKEHNFQRWKKAVGLDADFPELKPLNEEDLDPERKFYVSLAHQDKIAEILRRARTPRVMVLVHRGHGCTTLAQYVFQQMKKDSTMRALIPVHLALEDILQGGSAEEVVGRIMRRDVVWNLVTESWDQVLDPRAYAELLGAVDAEASSLADHRLALKMALKAAEGLPSWEAVKRLSSILGASVDDLLAHLSQRHSIRVSLQVDLSCNIEALRNDTGRHEEAARSLQRAMKALHEKDARKKLPTLPAVLNEMYFGTNEAYEVLQYRWSRPYVEVEYECYRQTDVFAILSYHYQPRVWRERVREERLATVLDPAIINDIVAKGVGLAETAENLRQELLKRMEHWDEVSYHIRKQELA